MSDCSDACALSFLLCTEKIFPDSVTTDEKSAVCDAQPVPADEKLPVCDAQPVTADEKRPVCDAQPVAADEKLPACPVTPPSTTCAPVSEIRRELRKYLPGPPYLTFSSKKLLTGSAPMVEHIWIVGTITIRHNARFSASKRFLCPTSLQEALAVVQDMIHESKSPEKNPKITGYVKICEHALINNTRLDVGVKEAVSRYANDFPPMKHIYVFTLPEVLCQQVFLGRFT